jgi:hypothetical protein
MGAGAHQFTMARDPAAVRWIQWLAERTDGEGRIFPASRAICNILLKKNINKGEGEPFKDRPTGLRAGGATAELLSGQAMEQIFVHVRWLSLASLRIYAQEGASFLVWSKSPRRVESSMVSLCPDIER